MIKILLISAGLILICVMFHGLILQTIARTLFYKKKRFNFYRIGILILVAILAHLLEIVFFQIAYMRLEPDTGMGTIIGPAVEADATGGDDRRLQADDIFYFSAVTYTSTGYGDMTPTGHLRLLAIVESLTGLIMVAWTTSYAFVVMVEYWKQGDTARQTTDA
jgi:hypothetical protein